MKIIFTGGMPSGVIRDPRSDKEYEFKRGEPVEVPTIIGDELCKRGDWKKEKENKP